MNGLPESWIYPNWLEAGVLAGSTTREGGCSRPPFDTFNVQFGQDDPVAVEANRQRLKALMGAEQVQYLEQVHGTGVLRATRSTAAHQIVADAMWTDESGLALVIQTADCLSVLVAQSGGPCIGAAHAGWRGLAGGVIPAWLAAMPCPRDELRGMDICEIHALEWHGDDPVPSNMLTLPYRRLQRGEGQADRGRIWIHFGLPTKDIV